VALCPAPARKHGATRSFVANVRPRLFYDLVDSGLLQSTDAGLGSPPSRPGSTKSAPAGIARSTGRVSRLPIRLWSLPSAARGKNWTRGNSALLDAGLEPVAVRPWPMDIEYFRSTVTGRGADLLFGRWR